MVDALPPALFHPKLLLSSPALLLPAALPKLTEKGGVNCCMAGHALSPQPAPLLPAYTVAMQCCLIPDQ